MHYCYFIGILKVPYRSDMLICKKRSNKKKKNKNNYGVIQISNIKTKS